MKNMFLACLLVLASGAALADSAKLSDLKGAHDDVRINKVYSCVPLVPAEGVNNREVVTPIPKLAVSVEAISANEAVFKALTKFQNPGSNLEMQGLLIKVGIENLDIECSLK